MISEHNLKLAHLMFALGVLTQAISFKPTKSIETTLQAILAMLILSAILSLVPMIKSKEQFDGLVFMSIYGLCFFYYALAKHYKAVPLII